MAWADVTAVPFGGALGEMVTKNSRQKALAWTSA